MSAFSTEPKTQEEREKTGWRENKKLGILSTQRHALKQQVSCERAVGGGIYMCVHTLWAAVYQQLRKGGILCVRVIGGFCASYLLWPALSHSEETHHMCTLGEDRKISPPNRQRSIIAIIKLLLDIKDVKAKT